MDKPPKYLFGLLETPASSSFSSKNGSISAPGGVRRSSSGPYRSTTSSGSGRVLRTPGTGTSSVRSTTPGSRHGTMSSASGRPRASDSAVVVALVEGRGKAKGSVGMASIDLKRPVMVLSQFTDSSTYIKTLTKLQILQPIEIIVPHTLCDMGGMTELFKTISDQFQEANIATVQKVYFNEQNGMQSIKHLCLPEYDTVLLEVKTKYYCVAACAALVKYVSFIQNVVYAPSSLKIVFTGSEQTTMIDEKTISNLELIYNNLSARSSHSLFGVLNYTKTPMGQRLLRANIVQPPSDLETVTTRLDVVTELIQRGDLFYSIQAVIGRFLDLDHLLSLCVQIPKQETVKTAEMRIANVLHLKHSLELVEPLKESLASSENQLLKVFHDSLEDPRYQILQEKIQRVINDDARMQKGSLSMRTQKCFAVKANINGLLDVSRKTYQEVVDDVSELVKALSEQYNLPLKVGYSATRGFFIQLYTGGKVKYNQESLPGIFFRVTKERNFLGFTCTDLIKLNDRVKESIQEIYLMTNVVVNELFKELTGHFGCLYKLTECVSVLDMLTSFAHNCTISDYVRPHFTDTLAVKQGRHPILEKITTDIPVPNDVYASAENNFVVITGPNMSGKSTYLRQIALLQIMAQMGSYVPAEVASFRIADQIFSRIGSDDDFTTNASTFVMEMREINYIMRHASNNSLIIIDELGRGTNADEGVGICHACCEQLLDTKAFTFFVTHFMELTNLESLYPNVENTHFEVQRSLEEGKDKVTFTHVLSKGKTPEKHYGLQLAEMSSLPPSVVQNARKIAEKIEQDRKKACPSSREVNEQRAIFKLGTRLYQTAVNSQLDDDSLRAYLRSLREQYYADMDAAREADQPD